MLAEVLNRAAIEFPDRIAYASAEGWGATFRQLDQFSDECAVWLSLNAGVREGDVVSLVMPSTIEYIVLFGAWRSWLRRRRVTRCSRHASDRSTRVRAAEPYHVDPALSEGLPASVRARDRQRRQRREWFVRCREQRSTPVRRRSATRVHHCFTSGSTGMPRGPVPRSPDPRDRGVGHRGSG